MNLQEFQKSVIIIIDSREKSNFNILKYLNENRIKWTCEKLDYGDYSFEFDNVNYKDKCVIERKANLDELAGNLTYGRGRFLKEFERGKEDNCKIFLMVESGSWEKIQKHAYRSGFSANAFIASLKSWEGKGLFELDFVRKVDAGKYIVEKFLEAKKWYAKNVEDTIL